MLFIHFPGVHAVFVQCGGCPNCNMQLLFPRDYFQRFPEEREDLALKTIPTTPETVCVLRAAPLPVSQDLLTRLSCTRPLETKGDIFNLGQSPAQEIRRHMKGTATYFVNAQNKA